MANYNSKLMSMFGLGGSMFGLTLLESVEYNPNILVLSSDVSTPAGLDKFKATYSDNFYNIGIAEQNMIGIAAGLTDEGYKTISVAQACFLSMRSFEQIRQYAGYMKEPLILVGIASGYSLTLLGNTHYSIEDIALMRTIPGMQVIAPCDAVEACKVLDAALKSNQPTYIRLFGGAGTPVVYSTDFDYQIGKAVQLREGSDLQIIATGSMVSVAVKTAEILADNGIDTNLLDMHTIKPLDESAIDLNSKYIISIEEHRVIGGLGDAIGAFLLESEFKGKFKKIGINDNFSVVGEYQYLLNENDLSVEKIVESIINYIK
ncbi:MAG: transketolase C-terminal domain-containing protein [Clostridia bacterium]|nr:transketolase C-terminal domain-containing protein [Clostridia bacterium]